MKICPFFYIAKAGVKPVMITFIIFLLAFFFTQYSLYWFILFAFTFFVYLNPSKNIKDPDSRAILMPIAGKIIAIENLEYEKLGKCVQITISNSCLQSGALRGLKDTKITSIIHKKGLFLCPFMKAAKTLNERFIYLCEANGHKFALKIQAGILGRNLSFKRAEDITQGSELGFLLDGMVSILLPSNSRLCANIGDKVKALDLLAYLPLENK